MKGQDLLPLTVAIPLVTAALIVITSSAPRRFHDALATSAAVAMTVLCAIILSDAKHGPVVEWLGGWHPHHHVAIGIAFAADQLGAGAALFASALLTASLVYSWSYFKELDGLVHALLLVLAAGMVGFCMIGDLFTMVVFFVVMSVAATGLTAVENEHSGPLQGALNFGVLNAIAGFALLMGATLIYGRTGALNLAQIGLSLDHHPPDALVAVGFALFVLAFLTKAGASPFHFWVPDAHAVAPTPVASFFSGAMVATALFGVARLLATAFEVPLEGHTSGVRAILIGIGALTAVVGALATWEQRHLKRLVAFATVSVVGTMLCGIGLLRGDALAGAALAAVGLGGTVAALLAVCGVLLRRYETIDEFDLQGRAREMPVTGVTFALGGLLLAGLPPTTPFFARWLIDESARARGEQWLPVVLAATSALIGAAVLRASVRVFVGWGAGEKEDPRLESEERSQQQEASEEEDDPDAAGESPSLLLVVIPAALLIGVVVLGLIPGFVPSVISAGAHFRDVGAYTGAVLNHAPAHYPPVPALHVGASAWIYTLASVVAAVVVTAVSLRGQRIIPAPVADVLRGVHSGHVGDYVAWWTLGVTVIGGLALWAIAG